MLEQAVWVVGGSHTYPDNDAHALALRGEGEHLQDAEGQDLAARRPQLHGGEVSADQSEPNALRPLHQCDLGASKTNSEDTRHCRCLHIGHHVTVSHQSPSAGPSGSLTHLHGLSSSSGRASPPMSPSPQKGGQVWAGFLGCRGLQERTDFNLAVFLREETGPEQPVGTLLWERQVTYQSHLSGLTPLSATWDMADVEPHSGS